MQPGSDRAAGERIVVVMSRRSGDLGSRPPCATVPTVRGAAHGTPCGAEIVHPGVAPGPRASGPQARRSADSSVRRDIDPTVPSPPKPPPRWTSVLLGPP